MHILVIGATGGTGRQIVDQALRRGHTVTALVRNPRRVRTRHERLRVVEGNVLDPAAVADAMRGADAVLCALGHKRWIVPTTTLSRGTNNIVSAMEANGVKRLVCETSLGVGDSWGRLGLQYTLFIVPFIIFFYYVDKGRQERIIRSSALDWTIVRPGRLTNGPQRGTYRYGENIGSYFLTVSISRADVAEFMMKQLDEKENVHRTIAVAD